MTRLYRAFVSSTFEDLKGHREFVIKALRDAGISVDPMENWQADSDAPKKFSVARVESCDVCVLLVAFRRGFIPAGSDQSITQLEYEHARNNRIDVLPFLLDEEAPWWPKYDERKTDPEINSWRKDLRENHGAPYFDLDPKSIGIAAAISRWLPRLPDRRDTPLFVEAPPTEPKVAIDRLPVSGGKLFGRDAMLREINEAWEGRGMHILCLIGFGGYGKSAVINAWLAELAAEDYRGARKVFGWSFASQEMDRSEASADAFTTEAFKWFGEPAPPANPWDRGRRLGELVKGERTLLILDGLEAVQHPSGPDEGKLKDQSLQALLKTLAAQNQGLCLISSRINVPELQSFAGRTVQVIHVDDISPEAGTELLRDLGVVGPQREFREAVREYRGHALSLTLLGTYLRKVKDGDIRRRSELDLDEPADAQRVIVSYEQWLGEGPGLDVLKILGLFNRPAPIAAIGAICTPPEIPYLTENLVTLTRSRWNLAVGNLRDLKLVADPQRGAVDADLDTHAIVRHHFAQQLRDRHPDAWREANNRLFEYYRDRPTKQLPDTLEEMADLFQAVLHGCRAGRHQETWDSVYWPRIRRRQEGYSVTTLNAYGDDLVALSSFFSEGDWQRPVAGLGAMAAAGACTEAAFDLRGLGRLDEAVEAQKEGLRRHQELSNWWGACDAAGNLSEILIMQADLAKAQEAAEDSIQFAKKAAEGAASDSERITARRTLATNLGTLGEVLHQRGQLDLAKEQFEAAERTLQEAAPGVRFLHALRGYHYCDLLLSLGLLEDIEERAAFAVETDTRDGRLYGVGLAHLVMARLRMARADGGGRGALAEARPLMDQAGDELRQAGHHELILRGLLASAELYRLAGEIEPAGALLEDVLTSAMRGQFKLLEADAHLQLAHVEAAAGRLEKARVHFGLGRETIRQCGYHRRDRELASLADLILGERRSTPVTRTAAPIETVPAGRDPKAAADFARAQAAFVDLYLRGNPVEGTQLGIPGDHDSRLPPTDPRERADLSAALSASAHALRTAARESARVDDLIDGDLAVAGVRGMRIVEDALRPYGQNPAIYLDDVARGAYALLIRTDLPFEQKAASLTARLLAAPEHLASAQRHISQAPRVLVENALGDGEGALQFLQREISDVVSGLPEGASRRDLGRAQRGAVEAMASFNQFVAALANTATEDYAIGRTAFEALLRDVHQISYDADELDDLGRAVVGDLEASLERCAKRSSGHSRWWEAIAALKERQPAGASLLADYRGVLERAREFVEQRDLVDLARVGPLVVQATPPFAHTNLPFAAYIPAPPFAPGGRGEFWVTTPPEGLGEGDEAALLRLHHPGRLLVACVHEGYPGHHVQFAHAGHVKRPLRHIFASTVFSEGWGLYCEDLMRREGFLMDGPDGALLEISMLCDQLWRALRIVIDVGLHGKGMTREKAVALLVEKHTLDPRSAESEVMYYCSAPGQPMSYMVGRILMDGLIQRRHAELQGAAAQPLGRVRDEVLSHGSLPFPLLERVMGLGRGQG